MQTPLDREELYESWGTRSPEERREAFLLLSRPDAEELFTSLPARAQAELLHTLSEREQRLWIRVLAPDDAADVIQESPEEERSRLLDLLDALTRKEVLALLAYEEDQAGGLMNPRYPRLRPDMSADAAISYLRRQTYEHVETIYYAYVLDGEQHLLGVVSLGQLLAASPGTQIADLMETDLVVASEGMDQEHLSLLFAQHDLVAIPVVDEEKRMKGVVTIDDIVDVVEEEATEDIQKLGGAEALEAPYLEVGTLSMLKKRVGWLSGLLLLGFCAVLALQFYEAQMARATVLVLFLPLIISSGGNSGSQAATLVVRAMALEQVRLRDWWRVMRREVGMGLMLGFTLGTLGGTTVLASHFLSAHGFGEHYTRVALTVACSIVCVALWGTLAGSLLPFGLRRIGLDPASASAPLVATIVDATGLVIYFTVAGFVLGGTLLS